MARNRTNRTNEPQARELTEAELDAVPGGGELQHESTHTSTGSPSAPTGGTLIINCRYHRSGMS
jgi:hypothetical protein